MTELDRVCVCVKKCVTVLGADLAASRVLIFTASFLILISSGAHPFTADNSDRPTLEQRCS